MLRKIAGAINEYKGDMNVGSLLEFVVKKTGASEREILDVVAFLQEVQQASLPAVRRELEIPKEPIVLADEIHFGYHVAKNMLRTLVEDVVADNDEVRKTLREIQRFLDIMLKMQERVYNVQEIQRFQEAVFLVLDKYNLRDAVLEELGV